MNYENDIRIDESALDIEWLDQPKLMLDYTRHESEMEFVRDSKKEELDLKKAELDLEIREDPKSFNITSKLTESTVNSAIASNEEFKKLSKEYNEARFEYNVAKGAVKAFEQRKVALENLVKLHGQQYFAGPKEPRNIKKERGEAKPESSPARIRRKK